MTAAALVAEDLAVSRGERPLFRGLGFSLAPGTALLLRGPNGSGKSTLLRALLGLAATDSGRLRYGDTTFEPRSGQLRRHAIYLGHASGMKPELPADRALAFAAELDGSPHDADALAEVLAGHGLARRATLACRQLSQGQRQRLALGRLALGRPALGRLALGGLPPGRPAPGGRAASVGSSRPLWLLDEPQTALDTDGLALFDHLLAGHLADGGSAIIAAHGEIATGVTAVTTLELGRFSARGRADRSAAREADDSTALSGGEGA